MSDRTYRLVVGTDGSDNAREALRVAVDLARRAEGRLRLVHVFQPLDHLDEMGQVHDFSALADRARERLEGEWSAPAREAGCSVETRLVHGSPAEALLDAAEDFEADFVVLGARGLGRLRSLMLGSTSSKALQASRCPVIIVPPPGR